VAEEALEKYPTTAEQDLEILKRDNEIDNLTMNERNCIVFRKMEKDVLKFLKGCAAIVLQLIEMKVDEAHAVIEKLIHLMTRDDRLEFQSMKNMDRFYQGYFKRTLSQLLDKGIIMRNGRRIDNIETYNSPPREEE